MITQGVATSHTVWTRTRRHRPELARLLGGVLLLTGLLDFCNPRPSPDISSA
jgi:hypothetical protein